MAFRRFIATRRVAVKHQNGLEDVFSTTALKNIKRILVSRFLHLLVEFAIKMSKIKQFIVQKFQFDRKLESNINDLLPKEIFIHYILKYLDLKGLFNFSLTCKKWNNHVHSYFVTKGDSSSNIYINTPKIVT